MNNEHDFILLMKKHPEMIDPTFSFKQAFTYFSKKMTQLIYQDKNKKMWIVYYFHETIVENQLGKFFDDMAKNLLTNSNKNFIVASIGISEKHKKLFDHLKINYVELRASQLEELNNSKNKPHEQFSITQQNNYRLNDEIILFAESLLRADLNTSWSDFSILVADKELSTEVSGDDNCKQRTFQIYYHHRLKYEGRLVLSYENVKGYLKKPRFLTVLLEEITKEEATSNEQESFKLKMDLNSCIDWNSGIFYTDVAQIDHTLSLEDTDKINMILQKWELHQHDMISLHDFHTQELDYFIQRLMSLSMLIRAAEKRGIQYM
ncbi:hypothetical protein [Salipaludibacillus daqingensis]|uniref:hypothetical protein n=1 Tax=Salipaludibacillus daqingensis TaxID=3041001 RepID=UPI0024760B1F|nr:hypothetical protein [Salipaludibacillus daqingensis]